MLFSIKDATTGIFGAPRVAESVEEMKRSIVIVCEYDKESLMSKFPEDFQLFKVGDFDITNGFIFSQEPEYICNLIEIVPQKNIDLTNVDIEKIQKMISDFNSNVESLSKDFVSVNKEVGKLRKELCDKDEKISRLERRTLWQLMTNSLLCKKS